MRSELLSICILTYNRASFLKENLDTFITQVAAHNIPIYVSDNCSTDDTQAVVEESRQKYPYIYYNRNETNLGFDGNVMKVVEMADSKFCWLFGDDDRIKEGAIDKVMEVLKANYDLIFINASTYSKDFSTVVDEAHWPIAEDKLYSGNDSDQLFSDLVQYATFVGSLIVNREYWNQVAYQKYMKTGFVHVGVAFEYIRNKKAYYIASPLIDIRLNNASWSSSSFRIWNELWPKAIREIPGYSLDLKRKVARMDMEFSVKEILAERAKGAYDLSVYKDFLSKGGNISVSKKMAFLLIALTPRIILEKGYIYFLKRTKPAGYKYILFELNHKQKKKIKYV
ncbi:glycosyltransferase family 2 protein [Chitinophaga tropicalis]|uniref:Glycosyltransferase n=1 Tax=Chitinophaga tropicalis TaxID=2683588 RepID=A0A7K1TZG9_9BACT|nr:glycosyltransferase family 2 protein [Chitinophaga tropicalis]MVT07440.1 glycosyltransferase [Chitinophaga tropicalis]